MNFGDERYVRVYTRDTAGWLMMPWQARAVFPLLLRKADRAGIIDLDGEGVEALAVLIGLPLDVTEVGVQALAKRGSVLLSEHRLLIPKFIEAQETPSSDRLRKEEQRARQRDIARAALLAENESGQSKASRIVTDGHETGQKVTPGHAESQSVTPNRAVPSCAEPSRADPEKDPPSRAQAKISPTPEPIPLPSSVGQAPKTLATDLEAKAWLGWHADQHHERFGTGRHYTEPRAGEFWAWYSTARAKSTDAELRAGYLVFLADEHWAKARAPWAAWAKQWGDFVNRALDAAEAEPAIPPVDFPDTEAGRAWRLACDRLAESGRVYAAEQLSQQLQPVALAGGVLELQARDAYALGWVREHYGGVLEEVLAEAGLTPNLKSADEAQEQPA